MSIANLEYEDLVDIAALKLQVRRLSEAFNAFSDHINGNIDHDEMCDILEGIDPTWVGDDGEIDDEGVDSEDDDEDVDLMEGC